MGKASSWNAEGKGDLWLFDPETLVIVKDKTSSLWDERVNLPLDEALVLSIMERGVIEPIVVRVNGDKTEVVDGRQRVRATIEANKRLKGKIRVPAVGRRGDNVKLLGDMISANELRRDDGFIIKGKKAQRLLDMGATEDEVARAFGVTKPYLKVMLGSLNLHPVVLKAIEDGEVPATSVGKEIALLPQDEQPAALEKMREAGALTGAKGVEVAKNIRRGKGAVAQTKPSAKAQARVKAALLNGETEDLKKPMEKLVADAAAAALAWIGGDKDAFRRWPKVQTIIDTAAEKPVKVKKEPRVKKPRKAKGKKAEAAE